LIFRCLPRWMYFFEELGSGDRGRFESSRCGVGSWPVTFWGYVSYKQALRGDFRGVKRVLRHRCMVGGFSGWLWWGGKCSCPIFLPGASPGGDPWGSLPWLPWSMVGRSPCSWFCWGGGVVSRYVKQPGRARTVVRTVKGKGMRAFVLPSTLDSSPGACRVRPSAGGVAG